MSAKNSMHNIRGYSPNQWAFGQEHNRIASFLQQGHNMANQRAREDETFEQSLLTQVEAQKLFLQAGAKRGLERALRVQSRPLREFGTGDLVYYFRRGRKEGSRYGGHWHGPARVLCHEQGSDAHEQGAPGSVVWVSHAGRLLRCSPE